MAKNQKIKQEELAAVEDIDFNEEDKLSVSAGNVLADLLRNYQTKIAEAIAKRIVSAKWIEMSVDQIHEIVAALLKKVSEGKGPKMNGVGQELSNAWFTEERLIMHFEQVRDSKVAPRDVPVHLMTIIPSIRDALKALVSTNAQRLKSSYMLEQVGKSFIPGHKATEEDVQENLKTVYAGMARSVTNAVASVFTDNKSVAHNLADYADEIIEAISNALNPIIKKMWDSATSSKQE